MNSLILFLNRYSNGRTFVGLLLLYLIFPLILFSNATKKIQELAGKKIGPIDSTFGFSPQKTLDTVEEYGESARAYYMMVELTIDLAYPVVYSLLLAVTITIIYRKLLDRPVNYLNLLPFAILAFDYLENVTIILLLRHYPEQSVAMATLCELFKLVKWLLFGLVLFIIFYGLARLLFRRRQTEA